MELVFSTDGVHPRDRFTQWLNAASKLLPIGSAAPLTAGDFYARLRAACIADIMFAEVVCNEWTFQCNDGPNKRTDHGDWLLFSLRIGAMEVRTVTELNLQPGQVTIVDPEYPFSARFAAPSKVSIARLPRHHLTARVGRIPQLSHCALDASDSDLALALRLLATGARMPRADGILIVRNAIFDLLASAYLKRCDYDAATVARSRVLLAIHRAVQAGFRDPEFSVQQAARLAGVSLRYANDVLEEQNTSLSRLILKVRLEACAHALEDRWQVHRSVQDIAFSSGFSDPSYFGRSFRSRYGMTPTEYRKAKCETKRPSQTPRSDSTISQPSGSRRLFDH